MPTCNHCDIIYHLCGHFATKLGLIISILISLGVRRSGTGILQHQDFTPPPQDPSLTNAYPDRHLTNKTCFLRERNLTLQHFRKKNIKLKAQLMEVDGPGRVHFSEQLVLLNLFSHLSTRTLALSQFLEQEEESLCLF